MTAESSLNKSTMETILDHQKDSVINKCTFKTRGMNTTFSISYNKIARNLQKLLLNTPPTHTVYVCVCESVCDRGRERQRDAGLLFSVLRTKSVLHSWKPLCQSFVPCPVYYFVRLFGLTKLHRPPLTLYPK